MSDYNLNDVPLKQRPNKDYGSGRHKIPKEQRYVPVVQRSTFNQQLSNITETNSTVLNSNGRRNYLLVQNNGASDVFINFGRKADVNNLKIIAGGNYEPFIVPVNSIHLISALGLSNNCVVIEGFEIN